ncbi:MAG TPA: DUF2490 domain-containing protein [Flavisolibacter sp.]|nr:DUF2490 domain-containing protein [Flavisolibacter sp.]
MITSIFKTKVLFLAPLLVTSTFIFGQQKEWQNWNAIGFKIPIGKTVDLRLNELASLSPGNAYALKFAQSSAALSIDLTKTLALRFGDQLNYVPGSTNALRNRLFVQGSIENKFSRFLKAEHSLQAEFHNKTEARYHQRYIFTNSLSLRSRFSPLRLRPSVSYSLYYNVGGTPIQYYDQIGEPTVSRTPDGFHRGRFYARLNSRISTHVQLTLYYMNQSEFNFLTPDDKKINAFNPATGKISRPFEDYNVAGLSLQLSLGKDN